MRFLISCSRGLLDWVVRDRVLRESAISVRQKTEAMNLLGDRHCVTGVKLLDRQTQTKTDLLADLVIDATGSTSKANDWLVELGIPAVVEEIVDPGIGYASRFFQAPIDAGLDFPAVTIAPARVPGEPGKGGTLVPIENSQWIVTLAGTRGGEPPTDEAGFVRYAHELRHPILAKLVGAATPLGPIRGYRGGRNRRRRYERLHLPDGFIAVGDSVATFNPIYGHGMTVGVRGVAALKAELQRRHYYPGTSRQVQRAVAHAADTAWLVASGQDLWHPNVITTRKTRKSNVFARTLQRYIDRLTKVANGDPIVAAALLDVLTLSGGLARIRSARTVFHTLRGPRLPPLTGPTFTPAELLRVAHPGHPQPDVLASE